MPCSYCRQSNHIFTHCNKAKVDRAIEIYNTNTDHCYHLRKHCIHSKNWFLSNAIPTGRKPNEENWNYHVSIEQNSNSYNVPENNTIVILQYIQRLRPERSLFHGHRNLNYFVQEYSNTSDHTQAFVRVKLNENNKAISDVFIGQEGINLYQQYVCCLRDLREKRSIYKNQQRQLEEFNSLVNVSTPIETNECPICMTILGQTNRAVLRCGHQFCGDCIFHHIQTVLGTKCPCCRQKYALKTFRY